MAALGGFDLGSVTSTFSNIAIWTLVPLLIIGGIIAAIFWLKSLKKFSQYVVYIYERDSSGNIIQKTDQGGVFVNKKTGNKRLFLKKSNASMSPDNIPFVMRSDGKKAVYLVKEGSKNFAYLKISYDSSGFHPTVTEEDVNWALETYSDAKKRFSPMIEKWLPIIGVIAAGLIIIVMIAVILSKLGVIGEVLQTAKEVMEQTRGQCVASNLTKSGVFITG